MSSSGPYGGKDQYDDSGTRRGPAARPPEYDPSMSNPGPYGSTGKPVDLTPYRGEALRKPPHPPGEAPVDLSEYRGEALRVPPRLELREEAEARAKPRNEAPCLGFLPYRDELANRPLRIIHVGPCLGAGGTEVWLMSLSRFLDPGRARIVKAIVTVEQLVDRNFAKQIDIPIEIGREEAVRRAAKECDILVFWGESFLTDWLADPAHRPPVCVFVAHGEGDWTREVLDRGAPVIDHVVAVSARVRDKVCHGFPATTILNGVDTARLARTRSRESVRASLGFRPEDFVIGYLGRFSPEKRPEALVRAVSLLPREFKALLVGYGDLRPSLLELANGRIPGRFAFSMADNYLGDYYAAMDAFCLPSSEEGFGLVLLEAMLCNLPVITSSVGCVPEMIVDRVNGLVVDGTPDSIARAALLLRAHPHWSAGLALQGFSHANEHGHARRMAIEYEQLFSRLVWERRNRDTLAVV